MLFCEIRFQFLVHFFSLSYNLESVSTGDKSKKRFDVITTQMAI